jgi:hypothetical protein
MLPLVVQPGRIVATVHSAVVLASDECRWTARYLALRRPVLCHGARA